jgi:general L-amino acid transport system permease protein
VNAYVRTTEAPKLQAPANLIGIRAVLRERILASPLSTVLSVFVGVLLLYIIWTILDWAVLRAVWSAPDRENCNVEGAGACWPFLKAKFHQWMYGFYPIEERWRVNLVYVVGAALMAGLLIPSFPYKVLNALLFFVVFPITTYFVLIGGKFGLIHVETTQWGGMLVTLVLAVTSIVVSVPLGIVLALGRRSEMPIISTLCIFFIEVVRGVPLVLVLFMAANMFPLFMPPGVNPAGLLKALVGMSLFASAYMAEVVRGGLQAIPKGQYEAAKALGLPYWKMMVLIVLPQALKIVIPGIVNNFIGLFKDTSLVTVVSIFDLLGIVQSGFNDPKWASAQTGNTGYFALAVIYWICCFAMSRYSMFVERKLNTGHKR